MTAANSHRNGSIEWMRLVGAIGIVWFHIGLPGSWISYAALPVFMILLVYFGHGRDLGERAARLLLPWLLWSLVFAALKLIDVLVMGASLAVEFQPWMLLTGPAIHLWFLPFAFAFLAIAHFAERAALILTLPLSVAAIWLSNSMLLPIPLAQWSNILPAAFLGLWLAHTRDPVLVCGVTLVSCAALLWLGYPSITTQLIIATAAIWAALTLPLPGSPLSRLASDLSLGLYLIHPIMISVSERLLPGLDMPILFVLVTVASLGATWVLRHALPQMVGHRA